MNNKILPITILASCLNKEKNKKKKLFICWNTEKLKFIYVLIITQTTPSLTEKKQYININTAIKTYNKI